MTVSFSGETLMVPQKHSEASKFIFNSDFYITANVYPDFCEGLDGHAIKKCLKVFETKSLKHKDTSVGKLCFFNNKPMYIGGGSSTPTTCTTNSL